MSCSSCVHCFLAVVVLLFISANGASVGSSPNKLMVVLLDGFRWDYIKKFSADQLPGFNLLLQRSVTPVKGLRPVFPSLSYVNYYSLMTGLYAETHGQVDNYMYDIKHNTEFLIGENPEQFDAYWWDDAEPLWIGAVRQGKRAYMWYWPGCEVTIRQRIPNFCIPYDPNPSIANFSIALDQAVLVLRNNISDLAGVYLESVDATGHRYGPDNMTALFPVLKEIDGHILRILGQIETLNINLMVFSDHGMMLRVGGADNATAGVINVAAVAADWEHVAGSMSGTVLHIWPKDGKLESMYTQLRGLHPNLTVYKKQDIPEIYHLKNHYRVGPLYLVASPGYAIQRNATWLTLRNIGYHGYDNEADDMSGILMATGPDFKRGATFQQSKVKNVNLYQLMCHVMKLKAEPHNGTWSEVCDGLSNAQACRDGPYIPSKAGISSFYNLQNPTSFILTFVAMIEAFLRI